MFVLLFRFHCQAYTVCLPDTLRTHREREREADSINPSPASARHWTGENSILADPALSLDNWIQPTKQDRPLSFSLSPPATDTQPKERDVTAERKPVVLGLHEKQAVRDHSSRLRTGFSRLLRALRRQIGLILSLLTIRYLSFLFCW